MGRKRTIDLDALKTFLSKYKSNIVKESGYIAVKSDDIWKTIAQEMQDKFTPIALYTIVKKKNRYDVWNIVEYQSKENKKKTMMMILKDIVVMQTMKLSQTNLEKA